MKKVTTFLAFLLLTISFLAAQTLQLQENSFQNVKIRFNAGQIEAASTQTPEGTFSRIVMGDAHLSTEMGQPEVPVMVRLMEIPLCDAVNYEIVSSHYIDYTAEQLGLSFPLFPAQGPTFKSGHEEAPFTRNAATYTRNAWYGRDLIKVEKNGIARNINIATVEFSPVQYNPVTNMYRVYDDVVVNFTFENADIPATYEMKSLHGNAIFNGLQSRVVNPIADLDRENVFNRPIKYLIVANSMFRGQLDDFVTWKKRQGFMVEIAYTDDASVGTTTTSISNFIKAKYDNATDANPAPTYVLLVGDIAQIPVFNTHVSGESHKTDLYYFTWTSGDNYPDCFYGRFSAQNATHLQNILAKTMQYEQYTMPDPTYLDEAVLVAGTDANWSPTHANGQMSYLSNNYINTDYGYSNVHLYLYNSNSQAAQIRNDIGKGVGYANYTAHCSEEGWYQPEFITSQIPAMSNQNKYCFMIGNCCLSNKFDEDECFGEAVTRVANKGAVAYIGGSNSTLWNEDFYWSVGVRSTINANATYDANNLGAYDRLFHTHGEDFSDWYVTAGSMIYGGNLSVEASTSTYKLYYWEIYHLMGDPSLLPWLSQADPMNVIVDDALTSGSTTMQVTAVPYAYVALTQNGEVITAATADANGTVNLNFDPVTPENTYELAVSAQNYQPYFHTVTIITPDGSYVVAANPALTNGNEPNYGANVTIDVTLRNLGVESASNITATLSTTSDDVTITNNTVTLSSLAQSSEQEFNAGFGLYIADDIADNTVVPFTIDVTFDGNRTTSTRFNISLRAPQLSNTLTQTVEVGGNNDGAINPGETCTVRITSKNTGHAPAVNVFSHLTCFYDQVTIENDDINLGDIATSGDAVSEFTIQVGENVPDPFIIPFLHNIYAGAYSFTDTVYLFVGKCVEDFETGDFSQFNWTHTNNAWTVSSSNPFEGTKCAVSKSGMSSGSSCSLTLAITATTNDSISYFRRFTAPNSWYGNDEFSFSIDNVKQESITATTSWGRSVFPISAGNHNIKFTFSHNSYGNSGNAAIDYITFPMNGAMAPISIEDIENNILSVYPNPATDFVNIALPSTAQDYHIALFNLNGQQIMSNEITGNESVYTLNVKNLATGMYLISVFNKENAYTGKIIIQK